MNGDTVRIECPCKVHNGAAVTAPRKMWEQNNTTAKTRRDKAHNLVHMGHGAAAMGRTFGIVKANR